MKLELTPPNLHAPIVKMPRLLDELNKVLSRTIQNVIFSDEREDLLGRIAHLSLLGNKRRGEDGVDPSAEKGWTHIEI
jgi:hypothetical protein